MVKDAGIYRERFSQHLGGRAREPEATHVLYAFLPQEQWDRIPTESSSKTLEVFVNAGRWLVQCPDCNGAQYASKEDKRFFCVDCLNVGSEGKWLKVKWPSNVKAIEEELMERQVERTRNWLPDETVADLKKQRAEAGELS